MFRNFRWVTLTSEENITLLYPAKTLHFLWSWYGRHCTCLLVLRQLVDVLLPVFVLDDLDLVDVVELPPRVELDDLTLDALVARLLDLAQNLHVAVHRQGLVGLRVGRVYCSFFDDNG